MAKYLIDSNDIEIEEVSGTENLKFNLADGNAVEQMIGDLSNLNTTSKSNVVNAINEVYGGLTNLNTYSTTETIIGKWINNKPIYRKVVDLGQIQVTTSEQRYNVSLTNPDEITSLNLMMKFQNGTIWYKNWHIQELAYRKSDNALSIVGDNTATFEKAYITLEYTKTTD